MVKKKTKIKIKSIAVQWRQLSASYRASNPLCDVCNASSHIQCHHILSWNRYPAYRLNIKNIIQLCPSHHKWGKQSAESNAIWFSNWLLMNRPEQYEWVLSHV